MFELGLTDGVLSTLLGRLRGVRMKLYLLFSPTLFFFFGMFLMFLRNSAVTFPRQRRLFRGQSRLRGETIQ